MNNVEFKADGVAYGSEGVLSPNGTNEDSPEPEQLPKLRKGRQIHNSSGKRKLYTYSPKIFVNDGSNGSNLINTYSYRNYCTVDEKPKRENNYTNNYNSAMTSNPTYNAIDGLRLHPTGDSGGYSNFTTPQFIK